MKFVFFIIHFYCDFMSIFFKKKKLIIFYYLFVEIDACASFHLGLCLASFRQNASRPPPLAF